MDLNWLIAVRKALTIVGALQPFAKRACALLARLSSLESRREGGRLRNEADEIRNMHAYGKVVAEYARLMKSAGGSNVEVDALVADLLLARLRSYMRARGIVALRTPRTAKRRKSTTTISAHGDSPKLEVPPVLMERRNVERRAQQRVRDDDGFVQ